jgi:lipopolysaccharide transport system permease protein
MSLTGRLRHVRDLLHELVVREMKLRYERSLLGMVWAVVNPLIQIAIFTFVFDRIFHVGIPRYPLFVFTGLLAWNWFREALASSAGAITHNRELVRQPGFPVAVLPVVAIATPLVDFLAALPILIVFILFSGGGLSSAVLYLPLLIGLQFLLMQGIGFLLASMNVAFRDVQHLLGVGLMMLFYLTPVFYAREMVPSWACLIIAYRNVLLEGVAPDPRVLLALAVVAGVLLPVGWTAFVRARFRFVEEL